MRKRDVVATWSAARYLRQSSHAKSVRSRYPVLHSHLSSVFEYVLLAVQAHVVAAVLNAEVTQVPQLDEPKLVNPVDAQRASSLSLHVSF